MPAKSSPTWNVRKYLPKLFNKKVKKRAAPGKRFLGAACLSFGQVETEDDAEHAVGIACAADAEVPYLGRVGHVGANAGTGIIVADTYDAERRACVFGQLTEVKQPDCLFLRHVVHRDGQVAGDDFVDPAFDFGHLLRRGTRGKLIVQLAFLTFDMRMSRTFATEHAHHGLVEDMFGGVRRRKLLLVVFVELRLLLHRVDCFSS